MDENPSEMATDGSTPVSAVGNPEYLGKDTLVEPWGATGALADVTADVIDDEGSYLTCGAARDYYDCGHHAGGRQLVAA